MTTALRQTVTAIARHVPLPRFLGRRDGVVLMYHGVPKGGGPLGIEAQAFEHHVAFLKKHYTIASPEEFDAKPRPGSRIRVLMTFDDGFKNNAEVVAPILRRNNVPAVFFVSSRHATPGKYLWFAYLRMLEHYFPAHGFSLRAEHMDMRAAQRRVTIARLESTLLDLRPHPTRMYEVIEDELPHLEEFVSRADLDRECAGMDEEQVEELSADPLFTIGAHTLDHPYLTRCEEAEAVRQIAGNKAWLERITRQPCDAIAYPAGDYNHGVLEQCRQCGFRQGYGVDSHVGDDTRLELSRVGIYSPSLNELGSKVQWSQVYTQLRQLQSRFHMTARRP